MLYCPKCNTTYAEGSQRFCLNDDTRLIPSVSSANSKAGSRDIFTEFLQKIPAPARPDDRQSVPTAVFTEDLDVSPKKEFHTGLSSKVFGEHSPAAQNDATNYQTLKPAVRLVRPNEVPSGTASVGNRKLNPAGRTALSRENPQALIGQTIKGRYTLVEKLKQDDLSITYLAEDKIAERETVVRILTDKETDEFMNRIYSEERVSLSHLNHPNIAKVIDSGELVEGNPFLVTEMIDGFSLREKLEVVGSFDLSRTARIIRQTSYALGEAHQNGILHRNLKPENIFLMSSDSFVEQVKVTDFAIPSVLNKAKPASVKYFSPEQLEGKLPNFAGDIYSLGVICLEMLTGKYPVDFNSPDKLLKIQKSGQIADKANLPENVKSVLKRALAYEPAERYAKARDFGDALSEAVSRSENGASVNIQSVSGEESEKLTLPKNVLSISAEKTIPTPENAGETKTFENEANWERRSPEPPAAESKMRLALAALGVLAVLLLSWAVWNYILNNSGSNDVGLMQTTEESSAATQSGNEQILNQTETSQTPEPEEIESPPPPRQISQPSGTEYFQNSKLNLKGAAAQNFRGFTLYYPKDWRKNAGGTNFTDISKNADSGTPIEQFLVSWYDSKGTYALDKDNFPNLVKQSNVKFAEQLPNYRFISEREVLINGWKGYEMKFESGGKTKNGDEIRLWGRRIFIPTQRRGTRSGFVVTMIATSLSPEVKSVEDVGIKGDLASILETFEPSTLD